MKRLFMPQRSAIWIAAIIAVLVYAAVAFILMPRAIQTAHSGQGFAVLRGLMDGAATTPLESYLDRGNLLARRGLFTLTTLLLIGYIIYRVVNAVQRLAAPGPEEPVTPFAPGLIGFWFGLLAGLGETYYTALRTVLMHKTVPGFNEANLVTALLAPLAVALLFGALGLLMAGLNRGRNNEAAARVSIALFSGLTVLGWTLMTGRTSTIASVILGAGIAVAIWRQIPGGGIRFMTYVRPSILRGAALLTGLIILNVMLPKARAWYVNTNLPDASDRPNILWIVFDTERASSLELYGNDKSTAPVMTRFAGEAVSFQNAIAPSSWTLPSHASFFTGLPASTLKVTWSALPARHRTIAEVLVERGYQTAGFVGNLQILTPSRHLDQGFTEWSSTTCSLQAFLNSSWWGRFLAFRGLRSAYDSVILEDAKAISRRAERWLDRRPPGRPFFVFVNYYDVHAPYMARPDFLQGGLAAGQPTFLVHGNSASDYQADHLRGMLNAYESEISYVDAQVGQLIDGLAARGELERTLVILTSDHGELFGEHGLVGHGNSLYRPLLHVPLVVRLPHAAMAGTVVQLPVATENIAATILDVAGITDADFPGVSLSGFWQGDRAPDQPALSWMPGWGSAVDDEYYYVRRPDGVEELYRLADTEDAVDLAGSPEVGGVLERMRRSLADSLGK